MKNPQKCSLVYFHKYSDFCFKTEDSFSIRVAENDDGMTEFFVEYSAVSRKVAVFQQCALNLFREVSPTDWICGNSVYLIQLYQKERCVFCQNIRTSLKNNKNPLTL
ncbi:MAG: hypothetical protein NC177_04910 [Ruminococcus flavefaciens]|nr:hypothetical protein [Ruminococcus flavefaciens]